MRGFFETTCYKIMNSITTIEEEKVHTKLDIKSIEDFYDMEGNYIQTEIKHTFANKSKMLLTEEGNKLENILQEPSIILINPHNAKIFKLYNMTQEEKEQVKKHVLACMEKL